MYDAITLLADAATRAGSFDRKKVRNALAATQSYRGATGSITFDEHGDPIDKEVIIVKFEKGTDDLWPCRQA